MTGCGDNTVTVWVCDTPAYASADTLASCIPGHPETTLLSAVDHEWGVPFAARSRTV